MFYIDQWYFILIVPALIFAIAAQVRVKNTYAKYSNVRNTRALSGADAARQILDANGLGDVSITRIAGNLTDNYNPKTKVVSLSDPVYSSTSVAAVGIAAHEVGHAIQHNLGYMPIKIRNAILPAANIGTYAAFPLVIIGLIFNYPPLIDVGILFFSIAVAFQIITLPVELNASSRAVTTLSSTGILDWNELKPVKSVLHAAALTYVAAAAMALAQLLRLILLRNRR